MHPCSQVNIVCTALLRNNVEPLDISSKVFAVRWTEDELELCNEVAYRRCLSTAKVETANICTFNALLRPVGVRPGTHNDSVIKSMRAVGRGGMCSSHLRSIYSSLVMVKGLLHP